MGKSDSALPSRNGDPGTAPETCTAAPCPVTETLQAIGGKWKVLILWHLQARARRFSELHRVVSGISHKILTQELRDLEAEGLLFREVFPVVPPRVEYSLTEVGKTLAPVLQAMKDWGLQRQRRRHAAGLPVAALRKKGETLSKPTESNSSPVPVHNEVPAWV